MIGTGSAGAGVGKTSTVEGSVYMLARLFLVDYH